MSKVQSRTESEIVGARLRMFREGFCKMSRTAFALSIGIGSERLASYESGRAPLRFEVFQRINREHFINPQWLATGEGAVRFNGPMEGSDYGQHVTVESPRALFMEVYKAAIAPYLNMEMMRAMIDVGQFLSAIESLEQLSTQSVVSLPEATREKLKKLIAALESVMDATENIRTLEAGEVDKMRAATPRKDTIVDKQPGGVYNESTDMRTRWKDYQKKLSRLCQERGVKAALAKKLGVSRTMVSKWADPVKPSEPTADFAFRLIEWIDANWKVKTET